MKKIFIIVLFILAHANTSKAQNESGLFGGINSEKANFKDFTPKEYSKPLGYIVGAFGEFSLIPRTSMRLELGLNHSETCITYYSFDETLDEYTFKQKNLSLPILLYVDFFRNFRFLGGIQTHYIIKTSLEIIDLLQLEPKIHEADITSEMNKFNFYYCFGFGNKLDFC